jgi:hypothetical protein
VKTSTLIESLKSRYKVSNPERVANFALVYERKILATRPSLFMYCATLTEIQERTHGEFYYQEFVKPEASYFLLKDKKLKLDLFSKGYRPEQVFTCKGVLAVNLFHAYMLGYPLDIDLYDIPTAIVVASKIYEVWYNELGSIERALVNYRYYRNLYEYKETRIRLSRREADLMRTFNSWRDRYCRLNLKEQYPPNPLDPTLMMSSFV